MLTFAILTASMGCSKITYDYREEGLEKSSVHFFGQLAQKRGQQKNRINYYPGGLTYNSYTRTASSAQNYKFNGKELQEETGWYDYGARMYMPDVLRWGVIDNYADKYFSLTPYAYAGNNPLKYADPTGDTLVLVTLPGLNSKHSPVQDRQFLVDSRIAEQTVGFATEALNRFKGRLSVNNIFRGVPSSQISTGNTKAKGLSRHQGGFAIDFNGVKGLSDEERGELNSLAEKHGFNPLTDQMKDPPHFSINPLEEGTTLSDAVSENKGHFDQIFSAAKEGNITLNEITNKEGESVGFQIQVTDQSNLSKEQLSELIFNLINFTK